VSQVVRRRRRVPVRAVGHSVTFGPALALPAWGWADLGEPFRWPGLGVMTAAGLIAWPLLVLTVLFFIPALLVPRSWRQAHRNRLIARGIPREQQRSSYISKRLERVCLFADRYRCGACRARPGDMHWTGVIVRHLEVDHFRPWILGGPTTVGNCGVLCDPCNGIKSCYWEDPDGYEHYNRQLRSPQRLADARWVVRRLRRHRLNPLRWTRAAWALAA
jgi:HNH endonuclease